VYENGAGFQSGSQSFLSFSSNSSFFLLGKPSPLSKMGLIPMVCYQWARERAEICNMKKNRLLGCRGEAEE
jgi:hypothetical protein